MIPRFRVSSLFVALLAMGVTSSPAQDAPIPLIDTHAHVNFTVLGAGWASMDFPASIDAAITRMDRNGIRRSIFMPQPSPPGAANVWELDRLEFAVGKYPGRVALGGGGGSLNAMIQSTPADAVDDSVRAQFRAQAEKIASQGARVFGEISAHHLSLKAMGAQHGYQHVPADHPLLLLLADIAAERGIPIDLHLDLIPGDMRRPDLPIFNDTMPRDLKGNAAAFERLLTHNRKAVFVWAHAGTDPLRTRTVAVQRDMLARHPNLHMSLRLSQRAPLPVIALDGQGSIKPEWVALLSEFPDRFVLGSDFFHGPEHSPPRGVPEESLGNYRLALSGLPRPLAEAIGFRNAQRIYRLPELAGH